MDRPTLDAYFVDMTHLVKSRGTCPRRQVGAVVVKDKRVLTTGYNGAPRGFPHPCDTGCIRDELDIPSGMMADVCPCLHAEQNAILQAATTGVSIEGADIYCTTQPCTQCSRMIANCGLRRVVFEEEYADPISIGLLVTAGVELWKWDPATRSAHRYGQHNTFDQAQDALRKKWKAGAFAPVETKQHVVTELQEALGESGDAGQAAQATAGDAGQGPHAPPGDADDPARAPIGSAGHAGSTRAAEAASHGAMGGPGADGSQGGPAQPTVGPQHEGGEGRAVGNDREGRHEHAVGQELEPGATPLSTQPDDEGHGAIRDLAGDPDRARKIKEMLARRKERLQRALDESPERR